MLSELERLRDLLIRIENPRADEVDALLALHRAGDERFWRQINDDSIWAGAGSLAAETLGDNPGLSEHAWAMEVREFRELLVAVGTDLLDRDRPNPVEPISKSPVSRVSVSRARMRGASRVEWPARIRKARNKAGGPVRRNPSGSGLAGALRCRSSLVWNYHTTLLASCSPSRKTRFAATRDFEIGSNQSWIMAFQQWNASGV